MELWKLCAPGEDVRGLGGQALSSRSGTRGRRPLAVCGNAKSAISAFIFLFRDSSSAERPARAQMRSIPLSFLTPSSRSIPEAPSQMAPLTPPRHITYFSHKAWLSRAGCSLLWK
ncbi:hypothetical protein HPP92_006161 [Vanilla planifolia]|uniref:Uncharacterized protein n=1 Tax=Vanilla planifolia TaxID=51239 RepID=A0A835S0Y2_VANPL|nr:hypothetical protein HPP92_006161 [Vanilla planifolia]